MSCGEECLLHLVKCGAECCRQVRFLIPPGPIIGEVGRAVSFPVQVTPDNVWYFKLHGIRLLHGRVWFHLRDYSHNERTGELTLFRRCELLNDEARCDGHPDKKPLQCRELGWDSLPRDLTPNCVFRGKRPPIS